MGKAFKGQVTSLGAAVLISRRNSARNVFFLFSSSFLSFPAASASVRNRSILIGSCREPHSISRPPNFPCRLPSRRGAGRKRRAGGRLNIIGHLSISETPEVSDSLAGIGRRRETGWSERERESTERGAQIDMIFPHPPFSSMERNEVIRLSLSFLSLLAFSPPSIARDE